MFLLAATKPLNDNTKGFRFNLFGAKGIVRRRKYISRGYKMQYGKCFTALHIGKLTIYREKAANRSKSRALRHFAG